MFNYGFSFVIPVLPHRWELPGTVGSAVHCPTFVPSVI